MKLSTKYQLPIPTVYCLKIFTNHHIVRNKIIYTNIDSKLNSIKYLLFDEMSYTTYNDEKFNFITYQIAL